MKLSRLPAPWLRPFVARVWASETNAHAIWTPGLRELVLPTGAAHVVLRLEAVPVRIYSGMDDREGRAVGTSLIGGARETAYLKEVPNPVATVGALLTPGAIHLLSKASALDLAEQHTRLEDMLPGSVLEHLIEALREAPTLPARLDRFETFLSSRLPQADAINPLVTHAIRRLDAGTTVRDVATETGFSERHLFRTFTQWVGLAPKSYARVRRFGRVLGQIRAAPDLADLAAHAGYADQAHMTRDMRAFAGVTPRQYIRISPMDCHHLPIHVPASPIYSILSTPDRP